MFSPTKARQSALTSGYSLIELIITVGIILVVTGASIAGFISFKEKKQAEAGAEEIRQFLLAAKVKAQARQTPSSCDNVNQPLIAYRVTASGGAGAELLLKPICGINRNLDPDEPGNQTMIKTQVDKYQLGSNLSLESSFTIDFFSLHGGVDTNQSNMPIKVSRGNDSYQFFVVNGGEISEVTESN